MKKVKMIMTKQRKKKMKIKEKKKTTKTIRTKNIFQYFRGVTLKKNFYQKLILIKIYDIKNGLKALQKYLIDIFLLV